MALDIFRFQYSQNKIYKSFVDNLKIDPETINNLSSIPFLPISFFRSHKVACGEFEPEVVFESSGTTQSNTSRHFVKKWNLYEESFTKGFAAFYGDISNFCILGLLPGYLERNNSSLVAMVDSMIKKSGNPNSGFYLHDFDKLYRTIVHNELRGQPTLLIGVTYALLDFAAKFQMKLKHTFIMETGGMKGKRKEITRNEVHNFICEKLGVQVVHSEYGMTELLSQAYSKGNGIFKTPSWMRIMIRDVNDPLTSLFAGEKPVFGLINVIDLANLYGCCFIATDDIGRLYGNESFEVLGRSDTSMVRGCNLLVI